MKDGSPIQIIICVNCDTPNPVGIPTCCSCQTPLTGIKGEMYAPCAGTLPDKDRKELLIYLDDKFRGLDFVSRPIVRATIKGSIKHLDDLPPVAKKYSVNAYVDFLKWMDKNKYIERLGDL